MKIVYFALIVVLWINVADAQPRKQTARAKTGQAGNQVAETPQTIRPVEAQDKTNAESETYRKERDAQDDAFRTKQTEQNETIKDATKWIAVITGLNLVLALVFAFFAGLQWRAMREGQKQARELFDLVERPIILVESADVYFDPANHTIRPFITLSNKGRTGTTTALVIFEAKTGRYPIYPKHSGTGIDVEFVGAGDQARLGNPASLPTHTLKVDETMWAAIGQGKETLFIYGKGRYYDMAHKNRYDIEPFVFVYQPLNQSFVRDYGTAHEWQVEANIRQPAPWRPMGGMILRKTFVLDAKDEGEEEET